MRERKVYQQTLSAETGMQHKQTYKINNYVCGTPSSSARWLLLIQILSMPSLGGEVK
jgi:hypothetical protein